ncbi:MAG: hypothetical protein CVU50_01580 [Candidatus Cloacimonetes bacterium HGW-Cloacimonetes-3]|jgi:AcrR family transcriptional regulator|nr:MAG: hypothetical protein CVU50_01580 [Candidatus Cloacimonetes bacterium HGW-Cloacimonetes-3]
MDSKIGAEERIMQAAIAVFCLRGYDGARMQEIADSADISKASLHYYFRSKENLFRKTVRELFSSIIRNIRSRISEDDSIEEVIGKLVNGYVDMFTAHRRQAFYFLTELMKHEEVLSEIMAGLDTSAFTGGILERFRKEREAGTIIDIEPVDLLINIIGMSVFPIMAEPMLKRALNLSEAEFSNLLAKRKPIVINFVLAAVLRDKP